MINIVINIVLVLVILAIIAGAVLYIYKAKKRGEKCIGCPYAKQCGAKNCGCGNQRKTGSDT